MLALLTAVGALLTEEKAPPPNTELLVEPNAFDEPRAGRDPKTLAPPPPPNRFLLTPGLAPNTLLVPVEVLLVAAPKTLVVVLLLPKTELELDAVVDPPNKLEV